MGQMEGITRGQFIGWSVTILVFIATLFTTTYFNVETRLRALEVNIHALEIKRDMIERDLDILMNDTKEIKSTVHSLDKRLSIDEEQMRKRHE